MSDREFTEYEMTQAAAKPLGRPRLPETPPATPARPPSQWSLGVSDLAVRLTELGAAPACRAIMGAYGIKRVDDLAGTDRHKAVSQARHELQAWLKRHIPGLSYPDIGTMFRRDHTTIMSAKSKVADLIERGDIWVAQRQAIPREER